MPDFVPVNEPVLGEAERRYVLECLESGWISSEGPFVARFEEAFAARVGRRFGIAVSSGTAALDIAFAALGLGPEDEVIVPTFTIVSCLQGIVRSGARPVLVDAGAETWNADAAEIERRVTPRTKAILAVHIYGLTVDMAAIEDLAARRGLAVVEDAAQSIGQRCRGRPCGSFGDLSVVSFYPNKHVTTGEGGMVLTDDERLAERCRSLRNLCFEKERRFLHRERGWNYRMASLQAALGLGGLERLDRTVVRKREIGLAYRERLADLPQLELPADRTDWTENLYWVFGLVLADGVAGDAADLARRLGQEGIGTRPFFWPMHEQPVFREMGLFAGERHPVAERIARRGLYLPSGVGLGEPTIERVAEAVRRLVREGT